MGVNGQCLATDRIASLLDGLIPNFEHVVIEQDAEIKQAARLHNLVRELQRFHERNVTKRAGTGRRASMMRSPFLGVNGSNDGSSPRGGGGSRTSDGGQTKPQRATPDVLDKYSEIDSSDGSDMEDGREEGAAKSQLVWPIPLDGEVGVEPRTLASMQIYDGARAAIATNAGPFPGWDASVIEIAQLSA